MSFERWLPTVAGTIQAEQDRLAHRRDRSLLVDGVYRFEHRPSRRFDPPAREREFVPPRVDARGERTSADYRDYYTEETRRLVAEHFREEIERFRYSFG
jgi:hypothetical protein